VCLPKRRKIVIPEEIFVADPKIMGGTPVFAGTRVPVASLVDHLKAGDALPDFLDGFPSVSREQAEGFLKLMLESALATAVRDTA
jgi:uncharacterized protein (DUF433 family)